MSAAVPSLDSDFFTCDKIFLLKEYFKEQRTKHFIFTENNQESNILNMLLFR
jgi:hypothetical protein